MVRGTDISQFKRVYRERKKGRFPKYLFILLKKLWDLKYGENPNQHGAIYYLCWFNLKNAKTIAKLTNLKSARTDGKGKGGLSLTNTMDISRGMDTLKFFNNVPAVVLMKHNLVSGFAKQTSAQQSLTDLFRLARDADKRSNFGCTLVLNRPLDMTTAQAMNELPGFFVDVVAATAYEEGVIDYIQSKKKDIRIGQFTNLDCLPKFIGDETHGLFSIKEMPGGRVGVQDIFLTRIKSANDLIFDPMIIDKNSIEHIIQYDPPGSQLDDLLTAWYLNCSSVRSNGVVFVKNGVTSSVGSGQVERVGAIEHAIVKGMQKAMDRESIEYDPLYGIRGYEKLKNNPFEGAVVSSDAFFPFGDSIKLFARVGVKAVVQPFGSNRDAEVIDEANRHKIAMSATLERCFGHF